jgi:hypothetical protein
MALGAISTIGSNPSSPASSGQEDRDYWIQVVSKVSGPVLRALSERKLKAEMPVEVAPHGNVADRRQYTHLEAMGRLLTGIAPWLESGPDSGDEGKLRHQYAEWSRMAIQSGTDPQSPDFMNFNSKRPSNTPVSGIAFVMNSGHECGRRSVGWSS